MKSPFSWIYDVPLVGYAWRLIAGVARLPLIVLSYEKAFHEIHVRQAVAESRLEELAGARAAELQGDAERVAQLDQRVQELTQHLARVRGEIEQQVAQARGAFEQHVPALLNVVSSHAATARLLRREQAAIQDRAAQLEASTAAIGTRAQELDRRLDEIQRAFETIRGELHAGVAGVKQEVGASLDTVRSDMGGIQAAVQAGLARSENSAAALEVLERAVAEHRRLVTDLEGRLAAMPDAEEIRKGLSARLESLAETAGYLLNRVEFVRREALFEIRYGREPAAASAEVEPRVVNREKVEKALAAGLRLNVGCGHIPIEGYVNVDRRELPHVDVVAEADRLPFEKGSVAELFSAHLVEHFPREQLRRDLLPYWRSLVRPGGVLRCVVPDAKAMIEKYGRGEMDFEVLREVTFGSQDYAGDFHYNMFTPESIAALLVEAGFRDVSLEAQGRANGMCLEMEVLARA